MKNDLYSKTVLTVIAVCLVIQVIKGIGFPTAQANELPVSGVLKGYALVPVNADGSIRVEIKQSRNVQDVVIVGWRNSEGDLKGLFNSEGLPVRTTNP